MMYIITEDPRNIVASVFIKVFSMCKSFHKDRAVQWQAKLKNYMHICDQS